MTEAAISLPLIILASMLMLRMFVFYLDILNTGISEHREALEMQDSYRGVFIRTYEEEKQVELLSGGLLAKNAVKRLNTKAYLINEDILVRSGEFTD